MSKYYVGPEGPLDASLAIVAEKPGRDELSGLLETGVGRPLIGVTGKAVDRHLMNIGTHRANVRLLNSVMRFDNIGTPTTDEIKAGQVELLRELHRMPNLNCVVAMGKAALLSLSNFHYDEISSRRGSILRTVLGHKMVPTWHPSYYFHGEWRFKSVVEFDLKRALVESRTPLRELPSRTYFIEPNFSQALDWLASLRGAEWIAFDIETFRPAFVSCVAFSDDPSRAYCIPIMKGTRQPYWSTQEEREIWKATQRTLSQSSSKYVTQNGLFDIWHLYRHGVRVPYISRGFDTMYAHRLIAPDLPHALDFLTSIYTREPYYKNESGKWDADVRVPDPQFWTYNCLVEETPVLMHDLTWKPLRSVNIGDRILTVEENVSGGHYARKLIQATVTNKEVSTQECTRVITTTSELVGTADHRLLGRRTAKQGAYWATIGELPIGAKLSHVLKPETYSDHETGWLGGFLDGEGCLELHKPKNSDAWFPMLQFSQNEGLVLEKACHLFNKFGFNVRMKPHTTSNAFYVWVTGGVSETLRALSLFRPIRLLNKLQETSIEPGLGGFATTSRPTIVHKESVGMRTVVDITTTAGTFIANGYVVHNCKDAAVTLEVALAQMEDMRELGLYDYFMDHMMPQFDVLLDMQMRGIRVDKEKLAATRARLTDEVRAEEKALAERVGWIPNTRSYLDMGRLFKQFNVRYNLTKTGRPATDEESLMLYASRSPGVQDVLMGCLAITQRRTLLSGFTEMILDGRDFYHPSYDLSHAVSGRLSSSGAGAY